MRKVSLLKNVILAAAVVALASCGKDEPVDPTKNFNVSNPASIIENLQISKITNDDIEFSFTYDSEGKLKSAKSVELEVYDYGTYGSTSEYSFAFTDGKLTEVSETREFYQTNENQEVIYSGEGSSKIAYEYNEKDLISKLTRNSTSTSDNGSSYSRSGSVGFEYDADNRLVKELILEEDGDQIDGTEWSTFTWSGRNVTEMAFYEETEEGARQLSAPRKRTFPFQSNMRKNEAAMGGKYVYSEFDDKVNPMAIIGLLEGYLEGRALSANNAGKMVYSWVDESGELIQAVETAITYEYDEKERPVKLLMTSKEVGEEARVSEIIIVYNN